MPCFGHGSSPVAPPAAAVGAAARPLGLGRPLSERESSTLLERLGTEEGNPGDRDPTRDFLIGGTSGVVGCESSKNFIVQGSPPASHKRTGR